MAITGTAMQLLFIIIYYVNRTKIHEKKKKIQKTHTHKNAKERQKKNKESKTYKKQYHLQNIMHVKSWDTELPILSGLIDLTPVVTQGRVIHEAGEAEASGPGPRQGPGQPDTTKIYKVGPLWAPKFLERKFAVF